MNTDDIIPVRRLAIDSRLGRPLSGHDFSGSDSSYRLSYPVVFPKGTEASIPHGKVDNVSHARGLRWSEKRSVYAYNSENQIEVELSLIHI